MSDYLIVAIGTSYGGLHAMSTLLEHLPGDFAPAIVLVQHRSPDSDETLVRVLQDHSALPVTEAEDKEPIVGGRVYVAPPDYHLLVDVDAFALSTDAPVAYSRPSIDVFFESAAEAFGPRTIGVVLTGANADGAAGLRAIKQAGGHAVVQEPATAASAPMPKAAIAAARVDAILPLESIPAHLCEIVLRGHAAGAPPRERV
jgi:two-component system chemotaxis response regulator CheB